MTSEPAAGGAGRGPFGREERHQLTSYLRERLLRPVSLDVWTRPESAIVRTDRDDCVHCEDVAGAMRQLATFHPGLSFTRYDLARHADRAAAAGVDLAPTTVIRGQGRSIQFVGLYSALLFPAFVDVLTFVSHAGAPIEDTTAAALASIDEEVRMEVMVTPWEPYSAHTARLAGAFAAITKSIRLRVTEVAELPVLATQRAVTEVPVVTINDRRFTGAWGEAELVEQIERVLAGDPEPVIRDRILVARYVSEEEARLLAAQQLGREGAPIAAPGAAGMPGAPQPPAAPGSGLFVPGRD